MLVLILVALVESVILVILVVAQFEVQSLERVQLGSLDCVPHRLLEIAHVGASNSICLANDWNHGGPCLELAEHIEIQILVQASKNGTAGIDDVGILAGFGNVLVQTDGIQQEKDAVDMRILCSRGTDNLLLFTECVLKLGLEKGGDQRQLEVNNVLFEALGVPEGDAHSLAVDFGLEKLRGEG